MFREACLPAGVVETRLPAGVVENYSGKVNGGKWRQLQSAAVTKSSTTEQVPKQSVVDNDVTHMSQKTVNAKNALKRIETKSKSKTSQSVSHDRAKEARTVFVGNVALTVTKKVICSY